MFMVVLGHLLGDYLFQSKNVAIGKAGNKKVCAYHCTIYTFCVCLCTWNFSPLFATLIFLSHYPMDYFSFGAKWLKFIKGRDFMEEFESTDKYRDIALPFSTLIYAVVDNSWHLVAMTAVVLILSHFGLF